MNKTGVIYGINGPVVYLKGNTGFKMSEMVYVGKERLVGEVIALTKDTTTVQVFEETTGLKPGETVTASGDALSVTLGPGILNNIFDGIERPLSEIAKQSGKYISRGLTVDSLDTEKKWDVHVTVSEGEELMGGAIIAETQETRSIVHKSMVPPDVNGTVIWAAKDGKYTILDLQSCELLALLLLQCVRDILGQLGVMRNRDVLQRVGALLCFLDCRSKAVCRVLNHGKV